MESDNVSGYNEMVEGKQCVEGGGKYCGYHKKYINVFSYHPLASANGWC